MILRQVTHDDLGCASYIVGDIGTWVRAGHPVERSLPADDH